MTESVQELLNKSERSIDAAKLLLNDGYPDFSASRAYYAMFYVLQALMLDRNLSYSKHSGIIGAFGKEFVKTGIFDSRFHRYVLSAFNLRNAGDYGGGQDISKKKAALTISEAVELLSEIKRHLAGGGHE
ncbi:MAG: HEPN domain-containing protein [Deltaproteobacteria bacterium]|nr:HEPN domain-containing protein [Deltaproteobacteria bacterium]